MNNKKIIEKFWQTMGTNDFYAATQLLHEDYVLEWPQSGELVFGRENFAAINTNYPAKGKWQFTINQILAEGSLVITDVSVTDGQRKDHVITFSTIRKGKIWKQIEFWPEAFDAPTWRAHWVQRTT